MINEWTETKIEDIVTSISMGPFGSDIKTSNFVSDGVPIIRGGNLVDGKFHDEDFVYLTEEKADSLKNSNAFPEDIVFTHRGTLGQVGLIPHDSKYPRYVVSQSQMRITCDKTKTDPKFVYYFFLSPIGQNELLSNTSTTGVPAISRPLSSLKKVIIPLPPLPVQKKIASILSSLDDKIELNTRMNNVLEEIARALFHRWFVEFEFPNAEGKPYKSAGGKMVESEMGRVPEGWKVQPVSKLLTINPKLSLKKGQNASFVDMAALPMNSGSVSEVIMKEYGGGGSKFQNGDVLLARITPCLENGKTAIVDFLSEGEIGFGSTEFIVLRGEGVISTPFVYSLARDPEFRGHCIASMVGSSGRQRIQNACFGDFMVARPPDEIFERFNEIGMRLFNIITINTRQNKDLASMRDALLPKLMSGELNINS